ncbi:LYR motif-containing protein 5A [Cydia strobilella]|uniref:LYR motif-containing protein 5A n=1 Tax=Cydia strobilella TaxID=1100964 RepID=UPI0030055AE5
MSITRSEVLRLYKNLVLYSKSLTLTDPVYFKKRITSEFKRNKSLTDPKDISFAYEKGAALLCKGSVV